MAESVAKRVRTCVGCAARDDKVALHRVVRDKDGGVSYDATGRKPGRGAYVCSIECLENALKSRKLQRALKCGIDQATADFVRADMRAASGQER